MCETNTPVRLSPRSRPYFRVPYHTPSLQKCYLSRHYDRQSDHPTSPPRQSRTPLPQMLHLQFRKTRGDRLRLSPLAKSPLPHPPIHRNPRPHDPLPPRPRHRPLRIPPPQPSLRPRSPPRKRRRRTSHRRLRPPRHPRLQPPKRRRPLDRANPQRSYLPPSHRLTTIRRGKNHRPTKNNPNHDTKLIRKRRNPNKTNKSLNF